MNRSVKSGISISMKKSSQFTNILIMLSCILFFAFLTYPSSVFADDLNKRNMDFKGYESQQGYFLGENDFHEGARNEKGNEATGVIAAFLLVLANLTVLLSLILKGINSLFSLSTETKTSISAFNRAQKKYLRRLHYILNPIAICIAIVHFHLSSCSSVLPDLALILFLVLGILGLILKFQLSPRSTHKVVYGVHCSSITFSGMVLLLAIGHMI
jgi:hypothetical protein